MFKRLFLLLVLVSSCVVAAPLLEDPALFLQKIYRSYASGFDPVRLDDKGDKQILSDEFLRVVEQDSELANGEIGYLGYDPICHCQDYQNLVVEDITVISNDNQTSRLQAIFRPFAESTKKVSQTFLLKAKNGAWLIDDIVTENGSLHQNMLKSNHEIRRNSPVPER